MGRRFRPGRQYVMLPNKHLLPEMRGVALSVYVTLCAHADNDGVCYPGIRRICETTGYGRSQVFEALKTLIKLGVIERHNRTTEAGDPDSNLYHILEADYTQSSPAEQTGQSGTADGGSPVDRTGGSPASRTLTKPTELNQLTKNYKKAGNSSEQLPASPATIDKVREQLAAKGIVKPKHDDDIVRHDDSEGLQLETDKDPALGAKPAKRAGNGLKRANKAPVTTRQLATVRT